MACPYSSPQVLARAESVTRAAAAVAQELEATRAALKKKEDEAQVSCTCRIVVYQPGTRVVLYGTCAALYGTCAALYGSVSIPTLPLTLAANVGGDCGAR